SSALRLRWVGEKRYVAAGSSRRLAQDEYKCCGLESRVMYHSDLLDHFEHPRNVGEISEPDARVTVENPACGDVMLLTVKVSGVKITAAQYRTKGCVAAIACGS